jgi:hypothetical protein
VGEEEEDPPLLGEEEVVEVAAEQASLLVERKSCRELRVVRSGDRGRRRSDPPAPARQATLVSDASVAGVVCFDEYQERRTGVGCCTVQRTVVMGR